MRRTRVEGRGERRLTPVAVVVATLAIVAIAIAAPPVRAGAPPPSGLSHLAGRIDWTGAFEPIPLPNGWEVADCPGDAPLVCVVDGARDLGLMTLLWFAGGGGDGDPEHLLRAQAEATYAGVRADRAEVCAPGYRVETAPLRAARVDGDPAVRFAYRAVDATGLETERFVGYLVARGPHVVSVTTEGYDAAACIAVDETTFTPAELETFTPWFDDIMMGVSLPGPGDVGP